MKPGKVVTALAGVCTLVLLSAASCLDDGAKNIKQGTLLVRSDGDDALKIGSQRADDILVRIPEAVRPTLGARLRQDVSALSDDPQVQDALTGLAWESTCALVFGTVPRNQEDVAIFVAELAASFGISFFGDGEQRLADIVLDALTEQESEAETACNDLQPQ